MTLNDDEIINGIKRGDNTVWQKIYSSCGTPVLKMVRKNSGNDADAKEILQESMVALWQNVTDDKYRSEDKFSAYFMRIARLKWLYKLRTRKNKPPTEDLSENAYRISDESEEVLRELHEKEEKLNRLEAGIKSIDEKCRALFRAFYEEKRTLKEIAEEYGIKHSAMRKRIWTCRQKLDGLMA